MIPVQRGDGSTKDPAGVGLELMNGARSSPRDGRALAPSALQYVGLFWSLRFVGGKVRSSRAVDRSRQRLRSAEQCPGARASQPPRGEVAPVGPVCLPAFAMETTPGLCALYAVVPGAPLDSPEW